MPLLQCEDVHGPVLIIAVASDSVEFGADAAFDDERSLPRPPQRHGELTCHPWAANGYSVSCVEDDLSAAAVIVALLARLTLHYAACRYRVERPHTLVHALLLGCG